MRVDETRLLRVLLVAVGRRPEKEELELVARERPEPPPLHLVDGPLQELARRRRERRAVEVDVADRDRGLSLPGDERERREVGHELRVAEVDLGSKPCPVDHLPGVIDTERGDAEVEPVLARLVDVVERDDLVSRDAEQVGEVHAQARRARGAHLLETLLGCLLDVDGHAYVVSCLTCEEPGSPGEPGRSSVRAPSV